MITHLLYRSFSKGGATKNQLAAILEKSQAANLENGLTGLLVFRNNTYLQLLEGSEDDVLNCLKRIRKDPRHHTISTVFLAKSDQRLFPTWSMAHIPEKVILRPLDKITDVVENSMNCGLPPRETMLTILKAFISPDYLALKD